METKNEENVNGEILNNLILKIKTYFSEGVMIHISYKPNNSRDWSNGYIKEIKENYFVLNEKKDGLIDIFYSEIRNIERYTTLKERENEVKI